MRKILIIIVALLFIQPCFAKYIPQYSTSVNYWGIGGVFVNEEFSVYTEPSEESALIKKIKWDKDFNITCSGKCNNYHMFVAFYPTKNYAVISANDEIDGWAKVYCDQKTGDMGWVKIREGEKFIMWADFIKTYGNIYGYFLFKDIKKDERKLYAQPTDGARPVDSWEMAKRITPWFIKGNWMMAKVLNYDNTLKTGWLKWRNDDGTLRGFVNFKN